MRTFLALTSLTILACSSDNSNPDGGNNPDGAIADAGKDRMQMEAAPVWDCPAKMTCDPDTKTGAQQCVMTVTSKVVDINGAPLAGQIIFICGENICTDPLKTDAMGIPKKKDGSDVKDICTWFTTPAYKYLGGPSFVSFASATPANEPNPKTGDVTLIALPQTGVAFTSTGNHVSGGLTLTFASPTTIKYDPSEPSDAENQKFRAVDYPLAKAPPFFDQTQKIEVLYGTAPVNARLTPPAKLTTPNPKGWMVGTKVEFLLNGVDTFDINPPPPAPYGRFGVVATGTVTGANTIETDQGQGIPMLGLIGIRQK